MTSPLAQLPANGVSIWLDDLSRSRIRSGALEQLISSRSVSGVTTNPTIFAGALAKGEAYAEQVAELDSILESQGNKLDVVVQLTADTDEVVRRLLNRAIEQGRADDTEDVIRRRLEVYEEQTAPLTSVYAERGLLVTVDGLGEVDEVTGRILEALNARGNSN